MSLIACASIGAARASFAQPAPTAQPPKPAQPAPAAQPGPMPKPAQPAQTTQTTPGAQPAQTAKPAQAPPSAPVPAGDVPAEKTNDQKVIELFDKGTGHYTRSQWAEAEAAFQAAWELKKSYDIAGNLGEVELKLGQVREATEHLAFSLRQFPATGKESHRRMLQRLFDEARKQVVAYRVYVSVDGAQILLNGRVVGQSPLPDAVFAEPGKATIEAKLAGHEDTLQTFDSAKGWSEDVSLILRPKKEAPSGDDKGREPPPSSSGFLDGKSKGLVVGGAAVAGAGLVLGIVATVVANGASGTADDELAALRADGRPCAADAAMMARCADQRSALEAQATWSNVALVSFAAGGAALAATAVYALWPSKKSEPQAFVRPLPVVATGGGGVLVTGAF
jgi:tetratricopeptide (TPR) repeat protein